MKLATYVIVLPVAMILVIFLSCRGIYNENLWCDLAIAELQMQQLLDGRILYFGVHSKDGMFHLGPAMYYALYPVYRLCHGATTSLFVGALIINGLSLFGCAYVLNRFPQSMRLVAPPVILLSLWYLGAHILMSPYNIYLVILPFTVFILLCAGLADGQFAYLPWVVGVGSWTVQGHFGTCLSVALVGGIALLLGLCRQSRPELKYVVVSTVVAAVMWILPVLEWHNLQNVYRYFREHTSAPQPNALNFLAQGVAFLPVILLGDAVPAGLECVLVIGIVLALGIASALTWKHEPLVAKTGLLTIAGIAGLYWSVTSSPIQMEWGYYIMWSWALGTVAMIVIVGVALAPVQRMLAVTKTHRLLDYCAIIVSVLIVMAWACSMKPEEFPPEKRELKNLHVFKGDCPELVFNKSFPWTSGAPLVTFLYKHRRPFTTSYWKWPFNLPPSFRPEAPVNAK